ncbi:MAG: HRDC domain-containing protein, partial [Gemmatimonadota bacterium]
AGSSGPRAPRPGGGADRDRSPSHPVFQRLRALRKRLADEQDLPAYIVFSDRALWEMIDRRPRSRAELLAVPGVGPAKLERYGDAFLEALAVEVEVEEDPGA